MAAKKNAPKKQSKSFILTLAMILLVGYFVITIIGHRIAIKDKKDELEQKKSGSVSDKYLSIRSPACSSSMINSNDILSSPIPVFCYVLELISEIIYRYPLLCNKTTTE